MKERFEFVFYINDKIICQRYFRIDNFNIDSISSYEIKDLMDIICGMNLGDYGYLGIIPTYLKNKTLDYLWDNYKPYQTNNDQFLNIKNEKNDIFQFEIKIDGIMVSKSAFSGNYFHPKAKQNIDIKDIITEIISEIRYFLSRKNYTEVIENSHIYSNYIFEYNENK
jgi:hypothetical protein